MNQRTVTVIRGDGIGPSIMDAAIEILDHVGCGFKYEFVEAGQRALEMTGDLLPQATIDSIARTRLVLKGPLTTPIGEGFSSVSVRLRQTFQLYASVRPAKSFVGTKARYDNVDIINVRENTEGLYCGRGQKLSEDGNTAETLSVITRSGTARIARFAYEYARQKGRKKITIVHKANILKSTSGLFLKVAREIAREYPDITTNEMIIDNACMQLVLNPQQFDMILTTNLFGDLISDLCAGLVGGLGMAPGANIGDDCAMFEAVHGSAPDIAGKNIANPSSAILTACQMLDYLGEIETSQRIVQAVRKVIALGDKTTRDLGGHATTTEFTQAVIDNLPNIREE